MCLPTLPSPFHHPHWWSCPPWYPRWGGMAHFCALCPSLCSSSCCSCSPIPPLCSPVLTHAPLWAWPLSCILCCRYGFSLPAISTLYMGTTADAAANAAAIVIAAPQLLLLLPLLLPHVCMPPTLPLMLLLQLCSCFSCCHHYHLMYACPHALPLMLLMLAIAAIDTAALQLLLLPLLPPHVCASSHACH
jgi:hypothetical protein